MNPVEGLAITRCEQGLDRREQLAADARAGLTASPKSLPSRWFYDERGCALFEDITRLPEYYLTRAEEAILDRSAADIVGMVRPEEIVEIGSGSSRKTRALLGAMRDAGSGRRYVPFDVSEEAIRDAATRLRARWPDLDVEGIVGDFELHLRGVPRGGRRLVAFLGSTIGNLDQDERRRFLGGVRCLLEPGDAFLVGVDLVKDRRTLERAYDDASGVTAAFNLNVLSVLDGTLGSGLARMPFQHVARWVPEHSRIEMHLRAMEDVEAPVPGIGLVARFARGEEMRTEISCKFTREGVEAELVEAGLSLRRWDEDPDGLFALALAFPG